MLVFVKALPAADEAFAGLEAFADGGGLALVEGVGDVGFFDPASKAFTSKALVQQTHISQ